MSPQAYESALYEAKKELADAIGELGETQARTQELEQRIGDLRQSISVLAKLCGQEDLDVETSLGLTDAIRLAFNRIGQTPVTVEEMRVHLESVGFNTRRYGNLLASIHTVFARLQKQGEIKAAGQKQVGNQIKPMYVATDKLSIVNLGKALGEFVAQVAGIKK